jgi:DNA-directed RNA polymerase subunit omega
MAPLPDLRLECCDIRKWWRIGAGELKDGTGVGNGKLKEGKNLREPQFPLFHLEKIASCQRGKRCQGYGFPPTLSSGASSPESRNRHLLADLRMTASNIIPFPSATGRNEVTGIPHSSSPRLMKSDLIEKASKVIPHPPVLINLVSRRVRQLNQGRAPLINPAGYGMRLGQGDIALIEIIEGKITPEFADGASE